MWLLDVNMPRQLKGLLAELGINSETATERGWGTLVNGELLGVDVPESGVSCTHPTLTFGPVRLEAQGAI